MINVYNESYMNRLGRVSVVADELLKVGTYYACNQIGVSAKCTSTAVDNFLELASFEPHASQPNAAHASTMSVNLPAKRLIQSGTFQNRN